ncbi:MAG: hypothetical protein Q6362_008805 [Candidatus Wukongarchaeota archaeon]|nr:hypothetical protein [Candidatus Wukongarchaeota archaeon]
MYSVQVSQNKQRRRSTIVLQQRLNQRKTGYWKGVYKTLRINPQVNLKLKDLETQCLAFKNIEFSGSMISKFSPWKGKNVQKEAKFKKLGRLHNLISKDDQIRSETTPSQLNKSFIKIARKMTMFFPKGIVERSLYECLQSERNGENLVRHKHPQTVEIFLAKIEENLSRIKRSLRVHDEKWWTELSEYFGCLLSYKVVMKHMRKIPHISREMKFYATCKRFNAVFNGFKRKYDVKGDTLIVAEKLKEIFLKNYGKPGFICRNGSVEGKVRGLFALATKITKEKRVYIKRFVSTPAQAIALKKSVKRLQKSLSKIGVGQELLSKKKTLKKREKDYNQEGKEKLKQKLKKSLIKEAWRIGILLKKTDLVNKGLYTIYELIEKIEGKKQVRDVHKKVLTILALTLKESGIGYDTISTLIKVEKKTLYQRIFYLKKQLCRPIRAKNRHFCDVCKNVIEIGETCCYNHENTRVHIWCMKKENPTNIKEETCIINPIKSVIKN